jgi:hypothetical protein
MSFESAESTQASQTPRGLQCALVLIRAAFALWLVTFLVSAPISSQQTNASEIGRHDSISVGTATPSTLYRRDSVDKGTGLALDLGPMNDDFELPDVCVGEVEMQSAVPFVVVLTTQRRYAAPVRGPPCVRV